MAAFRRRIIIIAAISILALTTLYIFQHLRKSTINTYKFRQPVQSDFSLLTEKQLTLEKVTDPLPISGYCSQEVFLIISVNSEPESAQRRNKIRETWANTYVKDVCNLKNPKSFQFGLTYSLTNVVKTVFVIGKSTDSSLMELVTQEANRYKDIIMGDSVEHYRNLTLKTKLAMKWAYFNCKSQYFIKMDDDSFANPVALVEWLKFQPIRRLYTGWAHFGAGVPRNNGSKW